MRGVYKELNKLTEQGIIFKRGESYNVRLAWIMNLLAFADLAYERYTSTGYLRTALGEEEERRTEKFNDLIKLDRLWTQLILTFHQLHPGRIMCFWCPYQWFHLAHYFTCKQFYEAIDLAGHKRCHIIGNDSYLARRALEVLPKKGRYSFSSSPFSEQQTTYYTVVTDRIITVKIDQQTTTRFEELFSSVKSERDVIPQQIESLFSAKVRATLTTEINLAKATKLKKKFSEFFGENID